MSQVKIGVIGCLGRMGKALAATALDHNKTCLVGGTETTDNPNIGALIKHPRTGEKTDVTITSDAEALIKAADVVMDFTCPTATIMHASIAAKHKTAIIIGTTGLSDSDEEKISTAAKKTAVVYASNFSTGVNLLFYLTRKAARILDDDYDIEIVEMHHRDKVDAPSGTAISLGKEAAKGRGKKLEDITEKTRDGITSARQKGTIGFASLRGGNVAGEHTVSFNADDERIELSHKAENREVFARGAIKAAIWVHNRPTGLYNMADVLELGTE